MIDRWLVGPSLTRPPVPIGNTPVRRVVAEVSGLAHEIYLKDESANAFGSIKDRIGWGMLVDLISAGRLRRGAHIVEASSGNTGTALAGLGRVLGLKVTIVSGPAIAPANRAFIEEAGAALVITGNSHAARVDAAAEIAVAQSAIFINQYENPANPQTHRDWTAPEALRQVPSCTAVFLCASSGGTAAGFAMFAASNPDAAPVVLVDPGSSSVVRTPLDSVSAPGVNGFGSDSRSHFASHVSNAPVVRISDVEALAMRGGATEELGIDLGYSSAGVFAGALRWLARQQTSQSILCICADSGRRYGAFSMEALSRKYPELPDALEAQRQVIRSLMAPQEKAGSRVSRVLPVSTDRTMRRVGT